MPTETQIEQWVAKLQERYVSYLATSFYFKNPDLRASFREALEKDELWKKPIPEISAYYSTGISPRELAGEFFGDCSDDIACGLGQYNLYSHQQDAIRKAYAGQQNIVVATGTASGKTECFMYPILFELFRQHIQGELDTPGVRALILYPMNALALDQRKRLGELCKKLNEHNSGFKPTFGQYIGQTPENKKDSRRNGAKRDQDRLDNELVFREEIRENPPHILLTNYSMLEYLLIRPKDSPLFKHSSMWKYLVLDEAHQYRGVRGMEMGMLIRRLKQRIRKHPERKHLPFGCICTSATISSDQGQNAKNTVADFATALFDEKFNTEGIIFGNRNDDGAKRLKRHHFFMRALEGAFLVHDGKDRIALNRVSETNEEGENANALEIALCKECGQHYYVGKERNGRLEEANRDPSSSDFGVDYYLPLDSKDEEHGTLFLCRRCGILSKHRNKCSCNCNADAYIPVKKCKPDKENPDQIAKCEKCGYQRGGIGDPVQEIVHGFDGPNSVIATALHELQEKDKRKVLCFIDNRQDAAFFAWYAQKSYRQIIERNLIYRAMKEYPSPPKGGFSVIDLQRLLSGIWERENMFETSDSPMTKDEKVLASILGEAITDEVRVSLEGTGTIKWSLILPDKVVMPMIEILQEKPWLCSNQEAQAMIIYILDELRRKRAIDISGIPLPHNLFHPMRPQQAYGLSERRARNKNTWCGQNTALINHFLIQAIRNDSMSIGEKKEVAKKLGDELWCKIRDYDRHSCAQDKILLAAGQDNSFFRLNAKWLRAELIEHENIWECNLCSRLTPSNIKNICPRNGCKGSLVPIKRKSRADNHYYNMYKNLQLPANFRSEEHTAQINTDTASARQDDFARNAINLLSTSTTFEVGVDLGDLDTVFLRNVPPEPFNYVQRAGRAGRRETPGFVLTYCRRNAHDLYHFENPTERILAGKITPPSLKISNEKVVLRHITALVLAKFFGEMPDRFKQVDNFLRNSENPSIINELRKFCNNDEGLATDVSEIVPDTIANLLINKQWIELITGTNSRLAHGVNTTSTELHLLNKALNQYLSKRDFKIAEKIQRRINTIKEEDALTYLSRKAIIPKYGFPVDVVELDTHPKKRDYGIALQRDLSQAIVEYAAGSKVIANKKEWVSCGIKHVPGYELPTKFYKYDNDGNFEQSIEQIDGNCDQYISPIFGFVTPFNEPPKEPLTRTKKYYTTRPFFSGFEGNANPETNKVGEIEVTKAIPGKLVILSEGKKRAGFFICPGCKSHFTKLEKKHNDPYGNPCTCDKPLENMSLGYELVTDVVRISFPGLNEAWDAYSLGYALLLGAAIVFEVPETDLNITINGSKNIIMYDNVPGGAGLVEKLSDSHVLIKVLKKARERIGGECGCDSSCYGCLRNYRNQFAHPHISRDKAQKFLEKLPDFPLN